MVIISWKWTNNEIHRKSPHWHSKKCSVGSIQFYQRDSLSSGECANINCQRTHTRTHMYTTGNDDIFDAKLMMPLVHWS